jgi:nucleotide-binding universal stress UspA family protein
MHRSAPREPRSGNRRGEADGRRPDSHLYDGSDDSRLDRRGRRARSTGAPSCSTSAPRGRPRASRRSSALPGGAFEDLNTDAALQRAQVGAEQALKLGFQVEPRAELLSPTWQGIVNVADELDAAVIVIGSRGLSGAREVFEGSVSHEVAAHSHRPVLIVPPTA